MLGVLGFSDSASAASATRDHCLQETPAFQEIPRARNAELSRLKARRQFQNPEPRQVQHRQPLNSKPRNPPAVQPETPHTPNP